MEITRVNDELAVIEPQAPLALFGTTDPLEVIRVATGVATELAKVVNAQKLYAIVQGKKFPTVEAWTLLGSMLGVFPITEWVHELHNEDGSVRGFEARVRAQTLGGRMVGAGEARCIRGESKTWHLKAEEYAVSSMAQTRATSKALRGPLDFVFKLAGFQPTPAEEMPTGEIPLNEASQASQEAVQQNTGVQVAPSPGGPAPTTGVEAVQSGGRTEPNHPAGPSTAPPAPKSGPRAKRGNVVQAPQAAEKPVEPFSQGAVIKMAGAPDEVIPAPPQPAPVALDEGEAEYLSELRHQARSGAAVLRQLRIKMKNAEAALQGQDPAPVPDATPNEDSEASLAAFVAAKFPGKVLDALAEAELEAVTTQISDLIVKVEAQVAK